MERMFTRHSTYVRMQLEIIQHKLKKRPNSSS